MSDLSISAAEYAKLRADQMAETPFQDLIIGLAKTCGWLVYHTHDSRRSQPGFPDLTLVHAERKLLLFRELKTTKGKTSPEQKKWLASLTAAGHDAQVWRPIQWFDRSIERELDWRPGVSPW